MRFRWLGLAVVVWVGVASRASAEDPVAAARAAFQEASRHFDVGEYNEALQGFKRAYLLVEKPDLLFNIASCYRLLGEANEAIRFYERYLDKNKEATDRADVERLIQELRALPPKVKPLPPPTTPATTPTTAPGPSASSLRTLRVAGAVLLVAGAAVAVGGGLGFGLSAESQAQSVRAAAAAGMAYDPSMDANRLLFRGLSIGAWVVGGAAALVGVVVLVAGLAQRAEAPVRTAWLRTAATGVLAW